MNTINLHRYGLNPRFEQEAALYADLTLARVTEQHRARYRLICAHGEVSAAVSGKLAYEAAVPADFPAVGDWVMLDCEDSEQSSAVIRHVLRRKSVFERRAAGSANAVQVVAANIDLVFICMALNEDYNLRRLERYLSIAWDSRAQPVVVLTKADLCADVAARQAEAAGVSLGADVVVCSSMAADGYREILAYAAEGVTIAFIGSSGVGKTTLINRLLGEEVFATREIRGDGKGRHTTTHRQLILLPAGGVVIDTPGMRELHLESGDLERTFADIEELAQECKFSDCTHTSEPGCAVRVAIESGALAAKRLDNFRKLQGEVNYEGMNARQREEAKINRMFNSKKEMKQLMRAAKKKNSI